MQNVLKNAKYIIRLKYCSPAFIDMSIFTKMEKNKKIYSLLLILVLTMSILGYAGLVQKPIGVADAQPGRPKPVGADWAYANYDNRGTGWSPQTQITRDNIDKLEMKWIVPFPPAPAGRLGGFSMSSGARHQGAIFDGVFYTTTSDHRVYAIDLGTGRIIWVQTIPLAESKINLGGALHTHGLNVVDGYVIAVGPDCAFRGFDALDGKIRWQATKEILCDNIAGVPGKFLNDWEASFAWSPALVKKTGVLVAGLNSLDGRGGRGYFAGFDWNQIKSTGKVVELWRSYNVPPIEVLPDGTCRAQPDWDAAQHAERGNIKAYPGDWGTSCIGGGASNWGKISVDEETGWVYVSTGQPNPDINATFRQGPNLFSASIMAFDSKTGERMWYHQTTPHDLYDDDCPWGPTAPVKVDGRKIVYHGCKNGYFYALDATTGQPVWTMTPPEMFHLNDDNANKGNAADMDQKWAHQKDGKVNRDQRFVLACPARGIEASVAFDEGNNIFVGTIMNSCRYLGIVSVPNKPVSYATLGVEQCAPKPDCNNWGFGSTNQEKVERFKDPATGVEFPGANSYVYGMNPKTGEILWKYFIDRVGYRGSVMVSGGVVYASGEDGFMHFLDSKTGKVLWKPYFGVALDSGAIVGSSVEGKMRLVFTAGGAGAAGPVPGFVAAFGLPDRPVETTKEVVKEVIKEVPGKEVIKEVPKTVTVEVISPVSYGIMGLGAIMVVASVVILATRRKKA